MAEKPVEITLYPDNDKFPTVECFQPEGEEILTEEFPEAQIFNHVVVQLEKRRQKLREARPAGEDDENGANKRQKTDESEANDLTSQEEEESAQETDENAANVIDPRIHYRPMVAELQAAVVELYQLVSTVDLIRPSKAPTKEPRYLEEVHCMRDDSLLRVKKEDLSYLLTSKSEQITDAADVLLNGAKSLRSVIVKERVFFKGVRNLLGRWKLCAPSHGTIPKPFRAGEGLAVDCSYTSAGSRFTPQAMPIDAIAYAELSRTEQGNVRIKKPEFYLRRTLKITLRNVQTKVEGHYILPPPVKQSSKRPFDQYTEEQDAHSKLEDENNFVLSDVQHSIFCEEVFQTVLQEALLPSSKWVDTLHSLQNYFESEVLGAASSTKGSRHVPMAIISIKDDQVQLHVDQWNVLLINLVDSDASTEDDAVKDESTEAKYMATTCKYAMALLQQEMRVYHTTSKSIREVNHAKTAISVPEPRVLESLVNILAHNLLKSQITQFLDTLAANLAYQHGTHGTVRVLDDGLCQPIADTVKGVFVFPRWKICQKTASISSIDFIVGKSSCLEVTIRGTVIQYDDPSLNRRQVCGIEGFRVLICSVIARHITECLFEDAMALGMTKTSMDNDHMTVRIPTPGDWDGTFVGEGKVPDDLCVGCITLVPTVSPEGSATVSCHVQAIDMAPVQSYVISTTDTAPAIDWASLPGASDSARLYWLLRTLHVLPDPFK